MFNDCKYKIGDIVLYNNNRYRIEEVHGYRRSWRTGITCDSDWRYEYDLVLDREPREGELSVIRGVDERAIKCLFSVLKHLVPQSNKEHYFPGYKFDPKFFMEKRCSVDSSLKALDELNKREFERIAASHIRIEIDDMIKANYSKEEIKKMINKTFGAPVISLPLTYKKIIFSGPCTIILWKDGTKTIAKTSSDEEVFDPEKGVAICFMKKMIGHTEANKFLRKASEQYEEYIAENRPNSSLDEFIEYLSSLKSKTKSVDQSTIDEVKKVEEEQDE